MNTQKRTAILNVVACVLVFVIVGGLFWRMMSQYRPNPQARVEMRHFMQQLKLGESKALVQEKFKAGNYRVLEMRDAVVTTPFELGANWQLHFSSNTTASF